MFDQLSAILAIAIVVTAVLVVASCCKKRTSPRRLVFFTLFHPRHALKTLTVPTDSSRRLVVLASILGSGASIFFFAAALSWIPTWDVSAMMKNVPPDLDDDFQMLYAFWPMWAILLSIASVCYFASALRLVLSLPRR